MKRSLKFFLLFLGMALFAWFVYRAGPKAIAEAFRKLGWFAPLVLLPYGVVYLLDTVGWYFAFGWNAAKPGFIKLVRIRWAGESFNNIVPTGYVGGEAVKVVLLKKIGFPVSPATASVVIGKTIQVSAQVVFIALGALLALRFLPVGSPARSGMGVVAVLGFGCVVALFWIQSHGLFNFVRTMGSKLPFRISALEQCPTKIRELDSQILKFYQQDRHAFVASGLAYLAGWLTDATELLLVSRLLDFPLEFGECVAIESFISVSKALGIFVPAAMGIQETGVWLLFRLFGLSEANAVAYALLRRGREVVFAAIGAVLLYADGSSSQGLEEGVEADGTIVT